MRQGREGDGGRTSKLFPTKNASKELGVPPTASELKEVPILKHGCKGDKNIVDGAAVNEEGKVYPPSRNVVKGAVASIFWKRVDVLDFAGFGGIWTQNDSVYSQ